MSDTTNATEKQKLMSSEDEQRMELAVAGPSRELPSPKIFKLNIDCFNDIFEYLSLKELHSVGGTCKTMQQVAGEYFKQNYSAAENVCDDNGIYTRKVGQIHTITYTSVFNEFMPCITHDHNKLRALQYFQSHIHEFKSTNHINLELLPINEDTVEFIKNILPKIEIVEISGCSMIGNFYELMLKYCEHLKCLYCRFDTRFNGKHEWLLHNYPQLEQLELISTKTPVIDELNIFFDRNPKVKRFSTRPIFLWTNKNALLKSNAKLDVLEIKESSFYIGEDTNDDDTETMKTIWDLLVRLHKQGFYKRLFIYTKCVDLDLSIKLNSVPGFELLCIRWFDKSFNLPFLINLKELIILNTLNPTDAQLLANGLVKLERLYVDETTIEVILPFIRQSMELKKIKMLLKHLQVSDLNKYFYNFDKENDESKKRIISNWKVLNLVALNKEREKLAGARKLTIYVRDDVFLATKWATRNGDINLSHIEMKRSDSFEWKHHYIF